jgi:hypothetical protein
MSDMVTEIQEVLFDLFDLRNENDDQFISGFSEFETLHEFLDDQIAKVSKIERFLVAAAGGE